MVPTRFHALFCWTHGYEPLDLLGKPWDRYHLELQLLQDSLKKSRMDSRKSGSTTSILQGWKYHFSLRHQFMVPTQFHELFCWIHGYELMDVFGKPSDRHSLELQLLQDSLKKSRMDSRKNWSTARILQGWNCKTENPEISNSYSEYVVQENQTY